MLYNSYAKHKGGMNPLYQSIQHSVDITLDILYGCEFSCPGCFNHRRLDFFDEDLRAIRHLVEEMNEHHYDFNELFLGPTDLFSASNLDDVLNNEDFMAMSKYFTFTATSTLMNDYDTIKSKIEKIEATCENWRNRNFEMFIVLDIEKYLAGDIMYLDKLNRNLELLVSNNLFFIANVTPDMFDQLSWDKVADKLIKDYGAKLRLNPSYLRTTNHRYVVKYAENHRDMIYSHMNHLDKIFLNMADVNFSGLTTTTLTLTKNSLYITPFMHENIPVTTPLFEVPKDNGVYTLSGLSNKENALQEHQFLYADNELSHECNSCEFLPTCVSRNVIAFMEEKKINHCFQPKDAFRNPSRINIG